MSAVDQALDLIASIEDAGELNKLAAVAQRRAALVARVTLGVGSRVQFTTRGGKTWTGTLERVNRKTATVVDCSTIFGETNPRGYRVPFSMLSPATD